MGGWSLHFILFQNRYTEKDVIEDGTKHKKLGTNCKWVGDVKCMVCTQTLNYIYIFKVYKQNQSGRNPFREYIFIL